MTAQDLKNAILQLAVQGKLVPQDPNDEPAAELLKRIKAEKERLIKEGKIKKEKTLAPISDDEIPFDIPESWEWVRLGSCFYVEMGQSPDGASVSELSEGLEFHQGKIFFGKRFLNQSPQKTSAPNKIAEPNSVLLCVRAPVGKVNITTRRICIGRGLCSVLPLANMDANFVYYLLSTFENAFIRQATGSTFVAITGKVVMNQPIPLPPLAEQQRIVAKIEELMPLLEEYRKAEERLTALNGEFPDKLRKSILQQAIQGKFTERNPADEPASELLKRIRAEKERLIKEGKIKKEKPLQPITEEEMPFEIPEGWVWVRLGDIADLCLGKMLDKTKNKGNLHPYLRNVNVRWGSFDFSDILQMRFEDDEEERYSVHFGDLVVCEGGEPGRCAVWADRQSSFRIQKALHRVRFYKGTNSFFAYRVFEFYAANGYFAERFTGATIKHLPGVVLANILFPLPPLDEQQRIVDRVNELLAVCDELK